MAAVRARHHFEDGARVPVTAGAEHDAFVGPLHFTTRRLFLRHHRTAAIAATFILWETPIPSADSAPDRRPNLRAPSRTGTGAPAVQVCQPAPCAPRRR